MRLTVVILAALALGTCSDSSAPAAPAAQPVPDGQPPIRVLMLTATAGFRHDSIAAAREVLTSSSMTGGELTVTPTEDLSTLSTSNLSSYDVLFFAQTSGELPLNEAQKSAVLEFVSGGKGFVGTHSATDTLYEWPDYGRLIGAYFREHPWTSSAGVIVEDTAHPTTSGLGDRFVLTEEFYTFRENPRPHVHVLLRLDAASVGASGDYPLAWTLTFGEGRVYYNALGHFSETWRDTRFQRQIAAAIRWVARR